MPSPGIQARRPDRRAHGIMVMRDEVPKSSPIEPNDADSTDIESEQIPSCSRSNPDSAVSL